MSKIDELYKSKLGKQIIKDKEKDALNNETDIKLNPKSKKVLHEKAIGENQIHETEEIQVKESTSKTVNSSTTQRYTRNGTLVKSKTLFLPPDILEMIDFLKFKTKKEYSQIVSDELENSFIKTFGENWREKIK